jgi:RNA polymerase sigma-70 factor, ECF subfamily
MQNPTQRPGNSDHDRQQSDLRGAATLALRELRDGDPSAAERLLPLVYDELRILAARQMRRERPGHTLQPTVLVHDVFLRLIGPGRHPPATGGIEWQDRSHFLGLAANAIRQILIDHARERGALKRGGDRGRVSLISCSNFDQASEEVDLLELNEALEQLSGLDSRQARVVELRFFGGLSVEETAHVLGVSARTVKGDWQVAKAWLKRELERA